MPGDMIFLPGQEPGPVASGVPGGLSASRWAAARLGLDKIPTGKYVANRFPWIRQVTTTVAQNQQVAVRRPQFAETFFNNTPHQLQIDELRFLNTTFYDSIDFYSDLMVKVAIGGRLGIIDRWMPVHALNTEEDRYVYAENNVLAYRFPAPYFLQRGGTFAVEYSSPVALPFGVVAANQLHGWKVDSMEPIVLAKLLQAPAGFVGYFSVAFDEDRDAPMEDCIITHFTVNQVNTYLPDNVLQANILRFLPPEGPAWHENEFIMMTGISEQLSIATGGDPPVNPYVIHRPKVPYILEPGESFFIDLWYRGSQDSVDVVTTVQGVQQGGAK